MTMEELQKILQAEGYMAEVDDDGDLTFRAQGRNLYASTEEEDSRYCRVFTDLFIQKGENVDELAVLREGNKLESRLKCLKIMLLHENEDGYHTRIAVECFTDGDSLAQDIERYIDIVCTAQFEMSRAL